jgi:hypothetical protein
VVRQCRQRAGGETPEAFSRIVLAEQEKWGAAIKALGIRVQP